MARNRDSLCIRRIENFWKSIYLKRLTPRPGFRDKVTYNRDPSPLP